MNDDFRPQNTRFAGSQQQFLDTLVAEWFAFREVTIESNGMLVQKGRDISIEAAMEDFEIDVAHLSDARRGISQKVLLKAFTRAIRLIRANRPVLLAKQLSYVAGSEGYGRDMLRNFMVALKGSAPLEEMAVIRHFIWQVKRKLNRLPVVHHMMPIITGPQGSGKSTLIQQLLRPLAPVVLGGRPVDFVTDERNFKTLNEHYVCFFDEMARASKTDADRLKEIISSTTVNYRVLYSHETSLTSQNCTFIGAANKDVRDLIYDTTGMRRFYQIEVPAELDKDKLAERWELSTWIDIEAIWKSVDETKDQPAELLNFGESIKQKQEDIRAIGSVEEFVEDCRITANEEGRVPLERLYNNYISFCMAAGKRDPVQRRTFARELRALGFKSIRITSGTSFCVQLAMRTVEEAVKQLA